MAKIPKLIRYVVPWAILTQSQPPRPAGIPRKSWLPEPSGVSTNTWRSRKPDLPIGIGQVISVGSATGTEVSDLTRTGNASSWTMTECAMVKTWYGMVVSLWGLLLRRILSRTDSGPPPNIGLSRLGTPKVGCN